MGNKIREYAGKIILFFLLILFLLTGCTDSIKGYVVSSFETDDGQTITITVERTPPPVPTFALSLVEMQETPESTCFSEIGYCEEFERMIVTFRSSDSTYMYYGFSRSDWDEFIAAVSLGSHYNECIKGKYECERVN